MADFNLDAPAPQTGNIAISECNRAAGDVMQRIAAATPAAGTTTASVLASNGTLQRNSRTGQLSVCHVEGNIRLPDGQVRNITARLNADAQRADIIARTGPQAPNGAVNTRHEVGVAVPFRNGQLDMSRPTVFLGGSGDPTPGPQVAAADRAIIQTLAPGLEHLATAATQTVQPERRLNTTLTR